VRQLLGVVPGQLLSEMIRAIQAGDARLVLERVDQLVTDGYELSHFCGQFTRYVRNLMIAKSCGSESPLLQVPNDERATVAELSQLLGEEDLTRFFQVLLRTEGEMRYSLQPRFHLELGLVKLVHARKLAPLESLLAGLRASGGGEKPGNPPPKPAAGSQPPVSTPGAVRSFKAQEATAPPPAARPVSAPALAPAMAPPPPLGIVSQGEDTHLTAIKSLASNQTKFLGSLLESIVGWRFENGTAHFLFPRRMPGQSISCRAGNSRRLCAPVCSQGWASP